VHRTDFPCHPEYLRVTRVTLSLLIVFWADELRSAIPAPEDRAMSTVLLVGEDDLLLQTRAAVLRTTGAATVCSDACSALAAQADHHCDLVVLCHSLPEPLCVTLAAEMHSQWPSTPILLVTPARTWESGGADEAINAVTSADPERLILRTSELLAARPPGGPNPAELPRA
jgi:hypothetical protein